MDRMIPKSHFRSAPRSGHACERQLCARSGRSVTTDPAIFPLPAFLLSCNHITRNSGVETLLRVYGHHHPDHMKDAVAKMTAKPTASASPQKRKERKKTNVVRIQ
jgi:hypothetical protein